MLGNNAETILVLAPHTDDGEFGLGASISKWVSEGRDVHYIAFSACQTAIPDGWPEDVLVGEVKEATALLGIEPGHLRVLDFEVRLMARDRQDVLQSMIDLRGELNPDLVVMPSVEDLHQDHHTVAIEGLRAFKQTSILAYEVPWNNIQFRAECFVRLQPEHVQAKVDAVKCYRSQAARPYADAEYLRAHLRFRGLQIGVDAAEAFEVVRWLL
jgi:LmbE family N-acetylglucosaminyl deacetylase